MKYASDMSCLIGNTPLVRVCRVVGKARALLLAKLEYYNPTSSVKDRTALGLLGFAEAEGLLKSGSLVVEPTSGNTGIGLAWLCSISGYRLILTMPDTMSVERRKILRALGAELVLTPGAGGMAGAVAEAEKIVRETPGAFMPRQFSNPANPAIHERTTAEEIWADTDGKVDAVIAGAGTGGTLTGVGRALKKKKSDVKIIAVEPAASPLLAGGQPAAHRLQGIGPNFLPDNMDLRQVDEIIPVSEKDAGTMARRMMREEGIFAGISSGAAMWAAVKVAARPEMADKTLVVILPDTAERYLSTWLFEDLEA